MTWSSQHYLQKGLKAGGTQELLERAIAQIEQIIVPRPELPALLTLKHLAKRSGESFPTLRAIVSRLGPYYRHFRIRKRSGGYRVISIPEPSLMNVQRWIATYILNNAPVHHCSFAFRPGASILKCASRHVGARWLIKLDITNFFGSISEIQVYRVFRSLGYQPLISFEMARLSTHAPLRSPRYRRPEWRATSRSRIDDYNVGRIGYLPQGAPTSPMLSNLVMHEVDSKLESIAKKTGLRYTRYSDDITFSTTGNFSRQRAMRLVWQVAAVLRPIGLHLQEKKTRIVAPGERKIVLGLLVDGPAPRLPRDFRSNLRQHLYFLKKVGPFEHAKTRGFDSVWGLYRHIKGLIDFANMVDPSYARIALNEFSAVDWATD